MIYSEYNQQYPEKGIVKLVLTHPLCTLTIPNDTSLTALDGAFTFENGNKEFSPAIDSIVETEDLTRVAGAIVVKNSQKWITLSNQLTDAQQGTKSYTQTTSGSSTDTNSVAGYDSDQMVDNDQAKNQTNATISYHETDNSKLSDTLNTLQNNILYGTIFSDIRNYLFQTIYN